MAHTYSVRTFQTTGPVELGGVAAAYEAAAADLAGVVPPDHRLIQLTEIDRSFGQDAVTVSFAALIEST